LVTLAPAPPRGLADAAVATAPSTARRIARSIRRARPAPTTPWWQWFDFDTRLQAQLWFITCTQLIVLVVGGLVIHASSASPY
jgi:hypothetical protein